MSSSHIYLGTTDRIKHFELRHFDDELRALDDTAIPASTPAWFVFDQLTQQVFAADSKGARLHVFDVDEQTGRLGVRATHEFLPHVVHLVLDQKLGRLYAASYDNSEFASYRISRRRDELRQEFHEVMRPGVHTHSSALDRKRNLVFAANKHGNDVSVYSREEIGLRKLDEIALEDARLLLFDETVDLLYCVTEADEGSSFLKILRVERDHERVKLQEVDSFKMGLRGADLKIDHIHRLLATTVRESGKEGVWLLPLTTEGRFDPRRQRHFLPIKTKEARSLEFAGGGRYVVVTCNNASNDFDLIIYKLDYEGLNIVNSKIIHQVKAGPGKFPGHLVIESEQLK